MAIAVATVLAMAGALSSLPQPERVNLGASGEPTLCLHHLHGNGPTVLYVHGATFPSQSSLFYRIDGRSWADDLHARGFDVWGLDFAGYGCSERSFAAIEAPVERSAVPGRALSASRQVERAAAYILRDRPKSDLSIIAHSWGTLPAGMFAASYPDRVARLVLFGPVARRQGSAPTGGMAPSLLVGASDQWRSFQSRTPADAPLPISRNVFDRWVAAYLASDPSSGRRDPPSVRIPAGPTADFEDAWSGYFPYDPGGVRAPTLVVRGEWDSVTRDADAAWLVKALANVPGGAANMTLPRGAHRMHLEKNRQALFDAVGQFLAEGRR